MDFDVNGMSSYRTYEEWKHNVAKSIADPVAFVLTVPMRNGNRITSAIVTTSLL